MLLSLNMRSPTVLAIALGLGAVTAYADDLEGMFPGGILQPGIEYTKRPVRDQVAALNLHIGEGKVQLQFEPVSGYLRSVLRALNVPVESQLLVFSKTSKFMENTNPHNPRAIYFNDSVTVAWVRGLSSVEVASQDPQQGVIFYALNENPVDQMLREYAGRQPRFRRDDRCIGCHHEVMTAGVPGMKVLSVFPAPNGKPITQLQDDHPPGHSSLMEHRWGGWYVTGKHGSMR